MNLISEALKKELLNLSKDLKSELQNKNVNASGALSNSIEVKIFEKDNTFIGQILANRYIDTIDKGRGKTRNFTGGLFEAIKEWLQFGKYNLPNTDSVAYAITKNITNKGSYLFRNNINRNVVGSVLNENALNELSKKIAEKEKINIVNKLINL